MGSTKQVRAKTENEDSRIRVLLRVRVQYTSKRHEEISLAHLDVTRSQLGRAKCGTFSRDQPEHTGMWVTWRVAPNLFWGVLRHQEHVKT